MSMLPPEVMMLQMSDQEKKAYKADVAAREVERITKENHDQIDIEEFIAVGDKIKGLRSAYYDDPFQLIMRMRAMQSIQRQVAEEYKLRFACIKAMSLNRRGIGVIKCFAEDLKNQVWPDKFYWYG